MINRKTHDRIKSVARYPWENWFSKKVFTLRKGKDFTCAVHGMAAMIRNVASQRGVRVSLRVTDSGEITTTVVGVK